MKNKERKSTSGFTLIESLISLSLFTLITLTCLEFISHSRVLFTKLKEKFETTESIFFTLDRIRLDLHCGGQGLLNPINLGILESFSITDDRFQIFSLENIIELEDDLVPGQTYIHLGNTKTLKKGRLLCIFNSQYGETNKITEIDSTGISLSNPIEKHYQPDSAVIYLVRSVSFYMDDKSHILRRKVNTSPAQPLMEDIQEFACVFDQEYNKLIHIRIQMNNEEDKFYEIKFIPKNSTLASNNKDDPPPG